MGLQTPATAPPNACPAAAPAKASLWRKAAFPLLISLLVILAYAPALNKVTAADHIGYFAELHGSRSLGAGLALADYANARRYGRGDEVLYRPLMFIVMAVENTLFGTNHRAWNLANLAFHISACVALYFLLQRMQPALLAGMFACWAAVHPGAFEIVVWHHLGGYIIGVALALAAVSQAMAAMTQPQEKGKRRIALCAFFMLLSMLFYELMAIVCFALLFIAAAKALRKKLPVSTVAILILPIAGYAALYAAHCSRARRWGYVDRHIPMSEVLSQPVRLSAVVTAVCVRWTLRVTVPTTMSYSTQPTQRITIHNNDRRLAATPDYLVLWGGLALVWAWSRGWRGLTSRWPWVFLAAVCFGGYAAATCVGRSPREAVSTGYYLYFPTLLGIVGLCAIWPWRSMKLKMRSAVIVALGCVIVLSAAQTSCESFRLHAVEKPADAFLCALNRFVAQHHSEAGFSFRLMGVSPDLDPRITLIEGYPDDPRAPRTRPRLHEILFRPWACAPNPRYILSWDEKNARLKIWKQP
ncbi:MAG TPA: hypothetical protein P5137_01090 [Candidatus Brocadiia bacterium]|nr:hypothetical protein [Candidatus Brocadiia bacterium]